MQEETYCNHGLTGKDAAFLAANHNRTDHMDLKGDICSEGRSGTEATHSEGRYVSSQVGSVKDAVYQTGQAISEGVCDVKGAVSSEARFINDNVRSEGRNTNGEVRGEARWLQANIDRVDGKVSTEARFLDAKLTAMQTAAADCCCEIKDAVSEVKFEVAQGNAALAAKIFETTAGVREKLCEISKDQVGLAKDAQLTASSFHGIAMLEASKNAAASQLEAQKNASAVAIQNEKIAAAATLQACNIASEAARQLAECCCEMKLLQKDTTANILADGARTRELLQAQENQRLRDELAAAKQEGLLAQLIKKI